MTKYIQNLINEGLLEEAFNILRVDPEKLYYKAKEFNSIKKKSMENIKTTKFASITNEMAETYTLKNSDYGDSFSQSVKEFGPVAGVVRISDKFNRLKSLLSGKEQKVNDESVLDTLTDMACYCIMLRMELENEDK